MTNVPHPSGGLRSSGYPRYKTIYLHRFIWELAGNAQTRILDHVDGQPLNNAESNLRAATASGNGSNCRTTHKNTSGYRGVCWDKKRRRWLAQIQNNGVHTYIGLYGNIIEAAVAYDLAAIELHGEFAVTNYSYHHLSTRPKRPSFADAVR